MHPLYFQLPVALAVSSMKLDEDKTCGEKKTYYLQREKEYIKPFQVRLDVEHFNHHTHVVNHHTHVEVRGQHQV